jgi:hypothetical protein
MTSAITAAPLREHEPIRCVEPIRLTNHIRNGRNRSVQGRGSGTQPNLATYKKTLK